MEQLESITCGVEDEAIAAVNKLIQCVKIKMFPMMMSPEPYQPGKDICFDIATFIPCLEGLIDRYAHIKL